ncbi:MAG TPA: UvrD-helicase domain-containing protein [Gaiellaceae bacterium]|nr:UvrD-helicase domain-containing protein [Gaiellaceae bacterium]
MSALVPIDQDVRERIRSDLRTSLCVEAGAGTGKTTVLVARVVEILRSGHASVDEIAVITFTEAAAAELAARIRQELEDALASATDDDERRRIHDALAGLHRAHVETIHAFAAGLLRERPVEAGLDPGFEVLDALAAQLHFDAAYEEWLQGLLSEERPEVVTAVRRRFDLDQIRALVETVHAYRSLLPLAPAAVGGNGAATLVAEMQAAADECRRLLPSVGTDEDGARDMEAIVEYAAALEAARDDPVELDRQILYRAPRLRPGRGRKDDWDDPALCAESKALRKRVRAQIETAQEALRTEAIAACLPLAEDFVARYEAARKAEGVADFDDLLEWARDLLAESPEARAYFRTRFPVVLVDEFQDTDPVQADIALCIASDAEPGDDWLELTPRPGALTVVGDPKQSIYRFRRADIAVYDSIRLGPLAGREARLVQNFRSVKGVLDFANTVFDQVLVAQEGVQPANIPLAVGSAALSDESLSVCVVHGEVADPKAPTIRAEEARLLATTIRQAVEDGWLVRDRDSGAERPATYGDVVVLLPRRTQLDVYLDAFRRAGLPVRAEGGRSFFQRQEVRDLANLLQAVDDPLDQIALVASLRSTCFGCSDEEIFLHLAAGNRLDYRLEPVDSPESVAEALALMRDLHDLRSRVSLSQLVRATLEKTRLVEIALAGWDGQQSAANLVKLADQARAFSASGAGGLRGFARWLSDQRASSDEAEANVAEESDEVVRIMTIHASKGLEFPIVALANLGGTPDHRVEPVPDRRARRLHVRIKNGEAEFKTPGFDEAWAHEKEQKAAEEKRLLYVAVTRARDHLLIPVASRPDKPDRMLSHLLPFLPEWEPELAGTQVNGCYVVDRDALPELPDDEPPLRADAPETEVEAALAERAAWEAARATTVAAARDELEVHPATRDEGDEPVPAALVGAGDEPLIASADESPPRLKGEALHWALEQVDLRAPDDLEEVVRAICSVTGIADAAGEVLEMARACLESPVVARALAADELWREVPYTRRVADGYATGRIDLVFREGKELVVADWKSDSVGPAAVEAAAEGHRAQAVAYADALEAATGMRPKEVVFVFPRARSEWALEV